MHRRLIYLARQSRLPLTAAVLCSVLAGLCSLGQAYVLSATIDAVFLQHRTLMQVWDWMQWMLIIVAVRGLLIWLNESAANEVAVRVKTDLRQRLFSHLLALGPAYSRGERTGELTATITEGVEALDPYFGQYVPQLFTSVLVPATILLVVFPIDPLSGAILLLTAPLIPVFMYMIGRGTEVEASRQYETLALLSSHFLDSLQGLTTLKLFGQSKAQAKNIARICDQFRTTTLRVMQVSFLSAFALEMLATLSTAIIAVEVGLRLLYGRMLFREALFLLILAPEFYLPLRLLGMRFHAGIAGTAAARRIFQILDTPAVNEHLGKDPAARAPAVDAVATGATPARTRSTPELAIQLTDVSYTYPQQTKPALAHVSLSIPAGQHVALVGASGAGKTTLANLLLRFIQPTGGQIEINGRRAPGLAADEDGALIAWVPQSPHLFRDSIAANIRFGRPGSTVEEIADAARSARLEEFIESLPDKYDTTIGEGGARVSAGEAQRLALARAFLVDAPILILDEPTSSLDPENESLVGESVRQLVRGRTVVSIAHRLNAVYRADQIVVLEEGRVIEKGTHTELMTADGAYARFVKAGGGAWDKCTSAPVASGTMPQLEDIDSIPPAQHAAVRLPASASPATNGGTSVTLRLLGFLGGLWGYVGLSTLFGSLTIASSIALMGTSAWLISAAALQPSIAALELAIVGVRLFGIARAVFRYLERLLSHSLTLRLLRNIRVWFYEKLEPLAPARLMDFSAGDLLGRIIADVESVENLYVRLLAPPLTAGCVAAGCCLFFGLQNAPPNALLLVGSFLLVGLALPVFAQEMSRHVGQETIRLRGALHAQLVEGLQGLADILAFRRTQDSRDAIHDTGGAYASAQRCMARLSGLHSGLSSFLMNLAGWLALLVAIPLVSAGAVSGLMLASLVLITMASFEAVTPLPLAAQLWPATREAARRLFEVVDTEPAVHDHAPVSIGLGATAAHATPPHGNSSNLDLEVSGLSFTYPGRSRPALQDVTFRIPPGGSLGVIGPSGAGKSSLANLLLRFWDYTSGEIRLGGQSLKGYPSEQVRSKFGVVFPNTHFFDSSIYENLRLARRGVTRQEIEQAARDAQIHELIERLPRGYETLIGEHGLRLSAGERQRLAIARVLIKDPPFLILDEPTANLDALTESQILTSLFCLMRGKSTLFITHRLVGLKNLDQILVMENGMIVQRGSHDQLRGQGGLYRRLWELQNRLHETCAAACQPEPHVL